MPSGRSPVAQRSYRNTFVALIILAVSPYCQIKPFGQCVDDGDSDAVKPARDLVCALVELSARMEDSHYDFGGRLAGLMFFRGYAASVVYDGDAPVFIYGHVYCVAESRERFVDGVVYDLVYEVVQTSRSWSPMYMPGLFLTASRPSSTCISFAE